MARFSMEVGGATVRDGAAALAAGWGQIEVDREMSLYVVGLPYPNKGPGSREFEAIACEPGDPVVLEPEPKNPVDSQAVKVISSRGIQIGYLTKERCGFVGPMLAAGYAAVWQQLLDGVGLIRVRFGSGAPTLPSPASVLQRRTVSGRRGPIDADAFYPDPEPGEWGA